MRRLLLALALASVGCPSLPPPEPRPSARLASISRADAGQDGALIVRLAVDDQGAGLVAEAVDWELAAGGVALLRGRSSGLEFVVMLPPGTGDLGPGAQVRIRGAVHLAGAGRSAFAPFDQAAHLP